MCSIVSQFFKVFSVPSSYKLPWLKKMAEIQTGKDLTPPYFKV